MKRGRAVSLATCSSSGLDGHGQQRIEIGGDLPEEGVRIGGTCRRAEREMADPPASCPAGQPRRSRARAHR